MSFTLEIEFVGLCLFVPVPAKESDQLQVEPGMYVLMPAAGHDGSDHDVPPHVGRLCVNPAYLQPSSKEEYRQMVALAPMDRVALGIQGRGEFEPKLPKELVDVGPVVGRRIDKHALTGTDDAGKLTARVRLASGGCSGRDLGACWYYPPADSDPRHLPNRVCWATEIEGDYLELNLAALAGERETALPRLYPIGDKLKISVYNTPYGELPPEPLVVRRPDFRSKAHHFAAFYDLFDPPLSPEEQGRLLPEFYGDNCLDLGASGASGVGGGSPYTCMAAQSPPVPPSQ